MRIRLAALVIVGIGLSAGIVGLYLSRQQVEATPSTYTASAQVVVESGDATAQRGEEQHEPVASVSEVSVAPSLGESEPEPSGSERITVPMAAFSGVLVDEEGRPVEGAKLSWTHYPETFISLSTWQNLGVWWIDDEWYAEHTVWAESGSKGTFRFDVAPDASGVEPSVIWATHQGHEALSLQLAVEPESWSTGETHVMAAATHKVARVVDGLGVAVPKATVTQLALVHNSNALNDSIPLEQAARMFLRREFESDEAGAVLLSPVSGEVQVQAKLEDAVSVPWKGEVRDSIELYLYPSFTASGRLSLAGSGEPFPGELSVVVDAWTGGHYQTLLRVSMDDDSYLWGPVQLPLTGADRYSFQLEAVTLTPRTQFISAPAAGDEVIVDFESSVGNELWFVLLGQDDEWLEGELELSWEGMDEHSSLSRRSRSDLYIRFLGCPTGTITEIRGTSPGYAPTILGGFEVPPQDPGYIPIQLLPGGGIMGRCLMGGDPVEDFELIFWPSESAVYPERQRVTGSEDGSFTMTAAPLGEFVIFASSEGLAPSAQQVLRTIEGEMVEVELELRPAMQGNGRVVDRKGISIPSAVIQPYFHDGRGLVAKNGVPIGVDSEGRFTLGELPPGRIGFRVTAPGYSALDAWAEVPLAGPVDLGTLQLTSLRSLEVEVRLVGSLDPAQSSQYSFFIIDPDTGETRKQSLSSEGISVFNEVDEATLHCGILFPGGGAQAMKVPPPNGDKWRATYVVGGGGTVVIDLNLDRYKGELPSVSFVSIEQYEADRIPINRNIRLPESGEVTFTAIPPGKYIAQVAEEHIRVYGSTLLSVAEGETVHATINFDNEPTVLRVVDKRGDSISGVFVSLYATDYPLWRRGVTDANGLCTIEGSSPMDAFVGLQHPEYGEIWGVPAKVAQGAEEVIEVEFDPRGELRLRVVDGATPLEGVACQLHAVENPNVKVAHPLSSDAEGYVIFDRLGAATYGVDLRAPGIWHGRVSLGAESKVNEHTVQLRRLGSARFQVAPRAGASPAGTTIELTSTEFGTNVQAWISEGRVQASPPSMATDEAGTLLVPGIPHGTYRWRATSSIGDVQEGVIEVPVHEEASITVRFL